MYCGHMSSSIFNQSDPQNTFAMLTFLVSAVGSEMFNMVIRMLQIIKKYDTY